MIFLKNKHFIEGNLTTLECSYSVLPQHGSIVILRVKTRTYIRHELDQEIFSKNGRLHANMHALQFVEILMKGTRHYTNNPRFAFAGQPPSQSSPNMNDFSLLRWICIPNIFTKVIFKGEKACETKVRGTLFID